MDALDIEIKNRADAILDTVNDSVVTIGLDKRVKHINRAAERLLGYKLKEAQGMPCSVVVHCSACENNCLMDQVLSTGRHISRYRTVLKNRNGQTVTASFNAALLKNSAGKVIGGMEVIRDEREVESLIHKLRGRYSYENILGKNHRMQEIYRLLTRCAVTRSSVLIQGECGTGKELVAYTIYQQSGRDENPLMEINCETLTGESQARELFGYLKGSFAGAFSDQKGCFELANGGTLLINEVGEMNLSVQAKLLKAIKDGETTRIGDTQSIRSNVRILSTTSRDLKAAVKEGRFIGELYDSLRMIAVELPPLRERRDDIPILIGHFLNHFTKELQKKVDGISPPAMDILIHYDYPGNIQDLKDIIGHAVALCREGFILPSHLPKDIFEVKEEFVNFAVHQDDPLKVMERKLLLKVLSETGWNYKEAAHRLKVSRTTFWRKIKGFRLERPTLKHSLSS